MKNRPLKCVTGKLVYPTKGAARAALVKMARLRAKRERAESYTYKCLSCDGWHLTKMTLAIPKGSHGNRRTTTRR